MSFKLYEELEPLDPSQREKELAYLTDPDVYRKKRQAAEKKAAEFTTDQWNQIRVLCKTNPFYLCYSVLNYNKLSTNLHGDVCNWIQTTEQERFRLLLLPRGCYKSTIYTIGDTIRSVLPDVSNSNIWPYCLGTDIRVCLMHEVAGVASKFLSEIQNHFLSNELLMALFPECIPDPRRHTINMLQFELPRKSFWKEKTIEAMGVGGRSQGVHYNILKPDDLMGKEAKDSKIVLQSTKDWIDNLQSFLTSFENPDHIDFTGTRWTHDDTYQHIMNTYEEQLSVYCRGMEEPLKDEDGNIIYEKDNKGEIKLLPTGQPIPVKASIFPEQYPISRLKILKKNPEIYNAQYLNDPSATDGDLDVNKLRYYYWRNRESFIAFDNRSESKVTFYHRELYKIILLDPAPEHKLGICVTGTDRNRRTFVLEAIKDSLSTPDLIKLIFQLALRWQIRGIVIEKVLFSSLYEYIFKEEMRKRNTRFEIFMQPIPRNIDKDKRIIGNLSTPLDNGEIYINETQVELKNEFKAVGYSNDIHTIDALSMGPRYWKPYYGPIGDANVPFGNNNYQQVVNRDPVTGYTPQ